MLKKEFLFFLPLFLIAFSPERVEGTLPKNSLYFDTTFLLQYEAVAHKLIDEEGFEEVYFPAQDDIQLNGLLRLIPDAKASIICCAGFYPGRKEGLSTFIHFIPKNYNILFFDARGHGKSYGTFLSRLYAYGVEEYKDVIGAIEFVHQKSSVPIIIYGICAGAFHSAHALIAMHEQNHPLLDQVKGLIFDSGLGSIINSINALHVHAQTKVAPSVFQLYYSKDSKKEVQERYLFKASWFVASCCLTGLQWLCRPLLLRNEAKTNLFDKMQKISCPIFFIHADDDTYTTIEDAKRLAEQCNNKICWWLEEPSSHACHHLKHKEVYHQKLNKFFTYLL